MGNTLNLSATHTYMAAAGTSYTAVLTVTDTTTSTSSSQNYYVIVQANSLTTRVNMAIDNGLWYMHTTMDRTTTVNANSQTITIGGWDGQLGNGCLESYDCLDSVGLDGTYVQAFEVSGHYENETNASADPYADDVQRGLARLMMFMTPYPNLQLFSGAGPYGGSYGPGGQRASRTIPL